MFPRLSNIKDFKEFKRNVNKSLLLMFLICFVGDNHRLVIFRACIENMVW